MRKPIAKYLGKLAADRSVLPGGAAIAANDDVIMSGGDPQLAKAAEGALSRLDAVAVVLARPALPFAEFLIRRAPAVERRIVPRDTETRTFLHDIPILRAADLRGDPAAAIASLLRSRKGIVAEGLGIAAVGPLSVEHAYINYSSVFHAVFVKYLLDVLTEGFRLPGEKEAFRAFRGAWLRPLSADGLVFRPGPLRDPKEILSETAVVGRYTVERGLVDSFFGNISCRAGDVIYISQTAASLDELAGCIDSVPLDGSTTTAITASSELIAHRRIYEACAAHTILHGHPKFTVAMSMVCEETGCTVSDCWKDCDRVRRMGDIPVVAGEIGAGGIAKRVPPVIGESGKAVVFGHGAFTAGWNGFGEAFRAMVEIENWSRRNYFARLSSNDVA